MNPLNFFVVIALVCCTIILIFLYGSRKVPTYTFSQLKEKKTTVDKLTKMKCGFKTMQELIAMCIIGAAVNSIQVGDVWTWGTFGYGLIVYLLIAFALYDFEVEITDHKEKENFKHWLNSKATDKELKNTANSNGHDTK